MNHIHPIAANEPQLSHPAKRTIYVLVRTDIPTEHQCVQAIHAGAEAGRAFYRPEHGIASVILLTVPDLASLHRAKVRIEAKGIRTNLFHEPDYGIGDSAIGSEPVTDAQRKHFMGFPLWRAPALSVPAPAARMESEVDHVAA